MSKKTRIILRVLSVTSLLEAATGLFFVVALGFFGFPATQRVLDDKHPHFELVFYVMTSANLIFIAMLFLSAVFLWRLQRKGLALLVCTLGTEILYLVSVVAAATYFESKAGGGLKPLARTLLVTAGIGNMGISVQIGTAYPLVAGLLIFLAYRYLGIPPRESG